MTLKELFDAQTPEVQAEMLARRSDAEKYGSGWFKRAQERYEERVRNGVDSADLPPPYSPFKH